MSGGTAVEVAALYRHTVRRDLVADHRMSVALQGMLARSVGARMALWATGLVPWTRRNFARWLFEDYPRALLATPRRWRRGSLSAPGAYAGDG
jgi:hypothetical protein